MKINIQIEDASPKELQRLFGGPVPGITFVPARPKIHEAFRAQEGKAPACIEETGCKDCKETGLDQKVCEQCSPPPVKKKEAVKKKGHQGNPYGIPHQLCTQDKKKYKRLYCRCKTKGIKYEEALKHEKPNAVEPAIKIEGADNLVDKMPEIRPPIREAHKRVHEAVTAANIHREPPAEFKVGAHVKQIKPYLDRKVSGIGCVTARVNGLVEVNFGGTQYYKIAPDCLEVIR